MWREGILGTHIAESKAAQLPASPSSVNVKGRKEAVTVMKNLKQILVAVLMGILVSACAYAQKNDNRPPKEQPKVVDKQKEKPPPNNNQNTNRKGKP